MAGREILLTRIPSLDRDSVKERAGISNRKSRKLRGSYDIFTSPSTQLETWLETPSREYLSRLARRETILHRPNEKVGAYGSEWEHKRPIALGNSAVKIYADDGNGWLPFESSIPLRLDRKKTDKEYNKRLANIKEIYFIHHGVMRNAKDYHKYFMKALGKRYDPETMLIIAPQFPAPIDLEGPKEKWDKSGKNIWNESIDPDEILRWRYNDWRAGEPAMNPNDPVDSFTAMDSLTNQVLNLTPNVHTIEFRGNSEGGQFLDRYLAFSKTLNTLEYRTEPKITIRGILSNPGTLLYFDPIRPIFDKQGEITGWKEYNFNSRENTWPFGLYDPTPYVLESVTEWPDRDYEDYPTSSEDPYDFALKNYLRRAIPTIGRKDDVVGGFHLPKGPGAAAQGNTRYRRMNGKFASLYNLTTRKQGSVVPFPDVRMLTLQGVEHDASDVFLITESYKDIETEISIFTT